MLQEPFLFSRTLRDNIGVSFEKPAEHETEIRTAARAATWETAVHSRLSAAHTSDELDALLASMTSTLRRITGTIRRKNAWPT